MGVAQANYGEFFGAGHETSAIGHQASLDIENPENGYYVPALMAFNKRIGLSFDASSVSTDFEPITNVVVKNSTNSSVSSENGDVQTDYQKQYLGQFHFNFPIAHAKAGSLVLNLFTPLANIIETNSGNSFLPEYVMYRSRYSRTNAFFHYAHPWNESFATSLGFIVGFQAAADVGTQASLNGTSYGSSADAKTKIKPALAPVLSFVYMQPHWQVFGAFQKEMVSKLEANANGEINDPTSALFDIQIKSMIFYDPDILRLGGGLRLSSFQFFLMGEYQRWSGFESPVIRVVDRGGVLLPSSDFETLKTKNIFVPKIGGLYQLTDSLNLKLGFVFRPTPLEGDFSGAGNTIDTDAFVYTSGLGLKLNLFGFDTSLGASLQYHELKDVTVTKTSGQENGQSGQKIGAPGYAVGGSVLVATLGMKVRF